MSTTYQAPNEEPIAAGEGITRTSDPAARLWPVTVTFTTGGQPMRGTVRAISAEQAEAFAKARHPYARTVTVGKTTSASINNV